MKTININLYRLDELSSEAQERALEKNRDINAHQDWHEFTIDKWKERLEELGFSNPDISFSGFSSQGDGASFTATINFHTLLNHLIMCNIDPALCDVALRFAENNQLSGSILRLDRHYSHEKTVVVSLELDYFHDPRKIWRDKELELTNTVQIYAREIMRKIYKELEAEYEYLTSDEAVKESLIINEYDFTAEGDIYHG